jgi:hypothetical protein
MRGSSRGQGTHRNHHADTILLIALWNNMNHVAICVLADLLLQG